MPCGIFMTFRIHLLPPHSGSADERRGKAGTNYRVSVFRKSVRGQNMLQFLFFGQYTLGGRGQKHSSTWVKILDGPVFGYKKY